MRQIKKGTDFYPQVETGGYTDKDLLSVKIMDFNDDEVTNAGSGSIKNIERAIEAHTGTTDGSHSAGSTVIAMASGNTLAAGDVTHIDGVFYKVIDATTTSITLREPLEATLADATTVINHSWTTTYDALCNVETAGFINVVFSHPEMDDRIEKYEIVNQTLAEIAGGGTSRKMVTAS